MLRKLNCFLNIVIGSFIGVFIGYGIYKFWHFKTYPNLYVIQSAPWYTALLLHGAMVAVVVVVCIILRVPKVGYRLAFAHHLVLSVTNVCLFIYQHNGTETSLAMDFIEQIDKA